jgi:hypothetical protein
VAGFHEAEIRRRLGEKHREERAQAKLLIGLGIPFAAAALFVLTGMLSFLLWMVLGNYAVCLAVSFLLVAGAMAVDTWKHPSEHWPRVRYYLGGVAESELTAFGAGLFAADGLFAGMPLMANVSDPANLAGQSERVLAGCSNVVLGGPRNIRKGLEQLRAARAREDSKLVSAASLFLDWVKRKGAVTEEEVAAIVAKEAAWRRGFSLASELGFLTRRKEGPQRLLQVKEASSGPAFDPEG